MSEFTTVRVSNEIARILKLRAVEERVPMQSLVESFIVTGLKLPPDQIVKPQESVLPPAYAKLPDLIAAPRNRADKLLLEMLRITLDTFDDPDEDE